ncbi:MAG TPA: AraC family transcriptional regulator [Chloroflexota bacterium]|nr:AraC family transcriptional regulator [Chloroflexota bacterium]
MDGYGALAASAQLSVVASSAGRGWDGIYAEEVWHRAADFGLPAIRDHLLVFHLGRPLHVEEHLRGQEGRLGEGSLTILPAEAPTQWQLGRQGDVRHLHLFLRPSFIGAVAAEAGVYPDRVEIVPTIGARDPRFEQIGLALLGELHADGLGGRIYTESLATLLAVQLLRHQSAAGLPTPRPGARLSSAALGQVRELVEEHLGEDLSLTALAGSVGLSPYHFARLFRASTGLSPHQYVIRRRVERARLLLATTDRSLASIAQDVGFASGSHLATHVRRLLGVSPSRLR